MNPDLLKQLSEIFHDTLSRCEHCGREGEVFDCDDCLHNKAAFAETVVNLLNAFEPDVTRRHWYAMYAVNPNAEKLFPPFDS